jgi:hypothetical protein
MWFISFILGVATSISLLLFGWSTYLERSAVATADAREREWLASMPMPLPPPRPPMPKARVPKEEVELVREPKPAWATYNGKWNARYARYAKHRYAKPRHAAHRRYAKPRYPRVGETW